MSTSPSSDARRIASGQKHRKNTLEFVVRNQMGSGPATTTPFKLDENPAGRRLVIHHQT